MSLLSSFTLNTLMPYMNVKLYLPKGAPPYEWLIIRIDILNIQWSTIIVDGEWEVQFLTPPLVHTNPQIHITECTTQVEAIIHWLLEVLIIRTIT